MRFCGLGQEESNPCQALRTLDCWLLMWADSWAQASGMLISANLGQLVEASGAADTAFFVSIFSVGNCLGRALIGLCSDALVRRGTRSIRPSIHPSIHPSHTQNAVENGRFST